MTIAQIGIAKEVIAIKCHCKNCITKMAFLYWHCKNFHYKNDVSKCRFQKTYSGYSQFIYLQSCDNSSDQDTLVILRKGQSPFNVSSAAGRDEDCFRATFESGSGGIRDLDRIVDDHHRLHITITITLLNVIAVGQAITDPINQMIPISK